ncbi:MAG TPA: endopeptidase La [Candidatus Paceibacterota bacterium]|nr:endopeptidase La [Verrucomicrobiota bacterium]HRZ46403.1 endopeptidase La [Candidatus Paceibacterota bacterium]
MPELEPIAIADRQGAESTQSAPRTTPQPLPAALPILGLADIVIFPGMSAPLLIESAESIRLIDDVVAGDRYLGVVLQRRPEIENPLPEDLYPFGCAARVLKMAQFPDNTVRVLVEGLRRIRLVDYDPPAPYLRARIELVKDEWEESIEISALIRNVQRQFEEVLNLSPTLSEQIKGTAQDVEDPSRLSDLVAANLNLTLAERQELLESADVKERLNRLLPLLSREIEVLALSSKIQKKVASTMSKNQRDFFLREQLRAIQQELGEDDTQTADLKRLREQIEAAGLPAEVRQVATKEIDRLQHIPTAVAEYTVSRSYLDWIVSLPWNRSTADKVDLDRASRVLNQHHHGLDRVKERLLEFIAVIQLKQQIKGPILCLVGPPGVGKTSLGQSIAAALGRKFTRIALGGMRDEAEIRGHRRTYVGALPGRIIQCLRRAESNNPVILLDELDKVGSDFRGDPAAALLEVLDPRQNATFTDHYLDLPFDLSRVLFITTANWLDPVHPALRDRLEVIELPSYTAEEKLQIARRYLVPRQFEEHGLAPGSIRLPIATLRRLIHDYTREAGVRQLEREIAALSRKLARRIARKDRARSRRIDLSPSSLPKLLGPARFRHEMAGAIRECGIATGLAWTPAGGDILFIEATRMPGRGNLILTGSLGEVMKESAQTALSYLRSQAAALRLDPGSPDKQDIHIHVPAGATPKDGPSAGLTIAVALASLFLQRRVRSDLAMTGEISLRGRILPVGGIKEKALAASRSGIRSLLLPEANRKEWMEVPAEVRERMGVHFVDNLAQAFPFALVSDPIRPRRRRAATPAPIP